MHRAYLVPFFPPTVQLGLFFLCFSWFFGPLLVLLLSSLPGNTVHSKPRDSTVQLAVFGFVTASGAIFFCACLIGSPLRVLKFG